MIHYFNPGHETAVLNRSPYYMVSNIILKMQRDLSFLPAWYGKPGDIVLVSSSRENDYYPFVESCFPSLPKPILEEDLLEHDGAGISCWGISPQVIHFFEMLNEKWSLRLQIPEWKREFVYLNSRIVARDCLTALQEKIPDIPESLIPVFCNNMVSIEKMAESSGTPLVAKSLYSSSGRGLLWLHKPIKSKEEEVLRGMLKKQGSVAIEQVLDKQVDFSMQFLSDGKGELLFEGYSIFETDKRGAYSKTHLYPQDHIVSILTKEIPFTLLEKVKDELLSILKEKYAMLYNGCIGVDMMIYKEGGSCKIHPCLEINTRYTMGYLGMNLFDRFISHSSSGFFSITFHASKGEAYLQHLKLQEEHPLLFEKGKIKRGYLPLCPISKESNYTASVMING